MSQWTKWIAAGCCLGMLAAANGCGGKDINGPITPAETKSFMGGPMPANSPWAKKLQASQNGGASVPKPHPASTTAPAPPHSL